MVDDSLAADIRPGRSHDGGELFREHLGDSVRRILLGTAWQLRGERIRGVPALLGLHLAEMIRPSEGLPAPEATLKSVPNVAGIVSDLSVPTLLAAYRQGLYPHSHVLAPKWLSPPERSVLFFPDYRVSKTQRAHIRKGIHRVTFDRAFDRVIKACSERRKNRWHLTWITPRIMRAYADLHRAGYAHSFEVWNRAGELVGGGYGVSVGHYYALESMFCVEDNSSKAGLTFTNWHLAHWGFAFADLREPAAYKTALGCRPIQRDDFLVKLRDALKSHTRRGPWEVEADPQTVAAWRPGNGPPAEATVN